MTVTLDSPSSRAARNGRRNELGEAPEPFPVELDQWLAHPEKVLLKRRLINRTRCPLRLLFPPAKTKPLGMAVLLENATQIHRSTGLA